MSQLTLRIPGALQPSLVGVQVCAKARADVHAKEEKDEKERHEGRKDLKAKQGLYQMERDQQDNKKKNL